MKMENLNKTQIVLLTLLTSFVTSIATGIITVTLMDQAPAGVTQTINRVVERTIETVLPGENQVTTVIKEVIIKEEDLIANAVEKSSQSLVEVLAINGEGAEVALGLGVVISRDGYIVTDKKRISGNRNNLSVSYKGELLKIDVVSGESDDVAILKILTPQTQESNMDGTEDLTVEENKIPELTPASLADSSKIKLGQAVVSFGGQMGDTVLTGIVSKFEKEIITTKDGEEEISKEVLISIITSIEIDKKGTGGPLLDTSGNILGINIISQKGQVVVMPINDIKELLFNITSNTKDVAGNSAGENLTKVE